MREPIDELAKKFISKRIQTKLDLKSNWSGVDSTKAKKLLGFKTEHLWEHYLKV